MSIAARVGVAAAVGALLLGLSGCGPEVAAAKPEPPKVTVRRPEIREVTDFKEYNGTTAASATVEVRSRVRGHIADVRFTDGQQVNAGDLLFELDARPFQLEIEAAKEQLNLDQAQLEAATQDEIRQKDLYDQQAARKVDLDKAIAARKSWDARIEIARQAISTKELDLEYSRITAPIAGQIGRALLTKGNLVNAGGSDPLLTTIVSIDPIYVFFNVDERSLLEYRAYRKSQAGEGSELPPINAAKVPFHFGLETDEGYPNEGLIDFAENRIESTTGTIELRGSASNSERRYVPGSRVRVRVPVSEPYQAVVVPDSAILSDQDRKYVLLLNEKNVVVRRDVKRGKLLEDGMRVVQAATEGAEALSPEDLVITVGLQRARVNYPVEPMDDAGNALASAAP
ncbi:MAG: efflux RND transporter periplasmic adaptor subunit [Planctomyces sp.]|nr:efflux RND transporter periplasmic adaptor subunit [Planctomyces sp.]